MTLSEAVEYHDDTQMVYTFVQDKLVSSRSYTPEEIAAAQARATSQANAAVLTTDSSTNIATLIAQIDSLQVIVGKTNATITAADTKDVARALRVLTRQVIRLTRLVTNTVDTTNVGAP